MQIVVRKKAQMKIQQMAFMLIAVTLFFALAGLFMLAIKMEDLKKGVGDLERQNAALLAINIANSPEFACGNSFDHHFSNCVDFDKIFALKSNIESYENFWGGRINKILIRRLYPVTGEGECFLGNLDSCNIVEILDKGGNMQAPVTTIISLCRKDSYNGEVYNKCELARLFVYSEDVEND